MSAEPTDHGPKAEVVPLRAASERPPEPEPPKVVRADVTEHPWTAPPARRPVLPPWLRHADQRRSAAGWAVRHASHVTAFHAVRLPLYLMVHTARSPRGLGRVLYHTWHWAFDREGHALRVHAVEARDPKQYAVLARIRKERVRHRLAAVAAVLAGLAIAAALLSVAWPAGRWLLLALAVLVLGYAGRPAGRAAFPAAVVSARAERLTGDIIVRALGALGLSGIDRVLREGREIVFASPVVRDGPGWRVAIDLPYGVTASEVIERREKLASGLRRPLGCVWPEPVDDEHAGRLVLFVADEPLSKARQPAWPLAKAGQASLFRPVPFGTDQRGRAVSVVLMFANLLIGSIPRMGKTVALRNVLLAAALDPVAELHVWELKGTGDLGPLAKVAHAYGSGADDDTIDAALADLGKVYAELDRRAKAIKALPRDLCPESKVTPQLAGRRSLRLHPLVFAIDECQEAFAHPEHGAAFDRYATALVKRGPALGIILLLGTQRPDAKSLPPGITANVAMRFCLKTMDQVANDMVLGTSAYKRGINSTLLAFSDKGVGWAVGFGDAPQVVRSYNVDGPAAERIADRARQLRAQAGTLTGYAAGDAEPAVKVSLLADIAAVIAPSEAEVWSEVICARLAELRPELYDALEPTSLAEQLGRYGVTTKQIWGRTAGGKRANRRGVARADVLAASAGAARSSTTASGQDPPVTSGNGPEARSSGLVLLGALCANSGAFSVTAGAAASGLPWWWPLALLGALAGGGWLYVKSLKWWPYAPCLRCLGHPGKNRGSNARRWGTCKGCGGTGRRVRLGARILHGIKDGSR